MKIECIYAERDIAYRSGEWYIAEDTAKKCFVVVNYSEKGFGEMLAQSCSLYYVRYDEGSIVWCDAAGWHEVDVPECIGRYGALDRAKRLVGELEERRKNGD